MKIIHVESLAIPEVKVLRFARFRDHRGYFTEPYRFSDFEKELGDTPFITNGFPQMNQSASGKGVVRGLHFQWNPYMGKLVRTLAGHMVDLVLDIRKGSPTLGKIIAYDMPEDPKADYSDWIWVPPGFAHGNFFLQDSSIEYLCSGEYSPNCEAGISPFSTDIDWSLCDKELKQQFDEIISDPIISEKDKDAQSFTTWIESSSAEEFQYKNLIK